MALLENLQQTNYTNTYRHYNKTGKKTLFRVVIKAQRGYSGKPPENQNQISTMEIKLHRRCELNVTELSVKKSFSFTLWFGR